jgi:hypothetical protein
LFLLKGGREVGHHILIVGYAVHIYGRRLVFPRLLDAGGILRSRGVIIRLMHFIVRIEG